MFDGRAEKDVQNAADEWEQRMATLTAADVRATQNVTFRTQTPHARLMTQATRDGVSWKVWDQNLIYGPWLEGTGSRNRTTRFKGYGIWRAAFSRAQARCVNVGQPIVAKWVGLINGS